jgi:hypothetical protein
MPKRAVNVTHVFTAHAIVSGIGGAVAFLLPNLFEYFLLPHRQRFAFRDNAKPGDRVEHLMVRMYGALVLGQAYIAWTARSNPDATFRRSLVHAYTLVFSLTFLALLRAQVTPDGPLSAWNWVNIIGFAALAASYGYYSVMEPIRTFDGLGKGIL